jgi:hypothetical protein
MRSDVFEVLVGLRLTIARRAADMLVLHFGDIRPHASGEGTVGAYALHVQCPWRLDGPIDTLTGRDDLWEYAGPGERPSGWTYEDGLSLQDKRLGEFMGSRDERTRSWVNQGVRHFVLSAQQTNLGDVTLELTGGSAIRLFPARSSGEAWRLFAPGSARHTIFLVAS